MIRKCLALCTTGASKGKPGIAGDLASNLKELGSAEPPTLSLRDIKNLNY